MLSLYTPRRIFQIKWTNVYRYRNYPKRLKQKKIRPYNKKRLNQSTKIKIPRTDGFTGEFYFFFLFYFIGEFYPAFKQSQHQSHPNFFTELKEKGHFLKNSRRLAISFLSNQPITTTTNNKIQANNPCKYGCTNPKLNSSKSNLTAQQIACAPEPSGIYSWNVRVVSIEENNQPHYTVLID